LDPDSDNVKAPLLRSALFGVSEANVGAGVVPEIVMLPVRWQTISEGRSLRIRLLLLSGKRISPPWPTTMLTV
jgi:hypothetical protein